MKTKILALTLATGFLMASGITNAGCVGTVVMGECQGQDIDYVGDNESSNQSSSGNRYQYDLNDPSDRLNYSIDQDAQRRDSMSVNPQRSIDRGLGEYGGGIYD